MQYCQQCGVQAAGAATFCSACGTALDSGSASSAEAPAMSDLPKVWQTRFALIDRAGGAKLPQISLLTGGERGKVLFNLWGFLFGPFYYLAKGLWKKAIVLFVLSSALIFVVALALQKLGMNDPLIPNVIGPIIFAVRANLDYYKKKVLGDNGWW